MIWRRVLLGPRNAPQPKDLPGRERNLAAGLFDPDAGSTLESTETDIADLFGLE